MADSGPNLLSPSPPSPKEQAVSQDLFTTEQRSPLHTGGEKTPAPKSRRPSRFLLWPTLTMSAPALIVLAALYFSHTIHAALALGAAMFVVVLTGLLLRPHLSDILSVAQYTRELARGEDVKPPEFSSSNVAGELSSAVSELRRSWRARNQELRVHLASSEVILDSLPDPLLMLDRNMRVTRANLAARELFQRDLEGLDLHKAIRDPYLLEAVDRAILQGAGSATPISSLLPDEREYRAHVEPLPKATAEGAVAALALHDVTTAQRMERMRTDFVANASHELRTPISTLIGFIETLQGPAKDDGEARERFLGIMYDQANRMSRLVRDLLSLSTIEANEHAVPSRPTSLARILRSVIDPLEVQAKEKGLELVVETEPNLPCAMGSPEQLTQVFQNLIDNAIKYTRPNGKVEISAKAVSAGSREIDSLVKRQEAMSDKPLLQVSVRDWGDGIAKEHIPRLTERFYRVDAARSRALGGTGLGLAIVKHILNRHKGALMIDSQEGKGSIFTVYLPSTSQREEDLDGEDSLDDPPGFGDRSDQKQGLQRRA